MTGLSQLGLEHGDLWLRYFGLGGDLPAEELRRWLSGVRSISCTDYDLVAQALNEAATGRAPGLPVPYADELR